MIGKVVSHYRILEKLGEGGMGVVYKAEDTRLRRTVALKFLPPALTTDREAKERFIHEAQAASALQHNNICTVHDIDETEDGQVFIVMDLYDGETLKKKIKDGPLKLDEAIDIAGQVAQGLVEAHAHGIIHRDIKPANIIITKEGVAKILDFGLAKLSGRTLLTKRGTTLGTAAYMSPEQAQGYDADHRTDVWSLGVMSFEMLTGSLPFRGEHEAALMYSIVHEEPAKVSSLRSDVPGTVDSLIAKALLKDRTHRYQTMGELLAELRSRTSSSADALNLEKSIVVLPFDNLSPDPENAFFADGLTEELIAALSKVRLLRVISRTTAMLLRGSRKDVPTIARELKVRYAMEGSVRRAGNAIRITAQLIDAPADVHLWGDAYTGTLQDIFGIQERVARAIVSALEVTLDAGTSARLAERPIANAAAYDYYLRAIQSMWQFTESGLTRAVGHLEHALSIEGESAQLHAALAYVYYQHANSGMEPGDQYRSMARKHAEAALQLNDQSALAYVALGLLGAYSNPIGEGIPSLKRALEIDPSNVEALVWLALLLGQVWRPDVGMKYLERMRRIDPLHPLAQWGEAYLRIQDGEFERAEGILREAIRTSNDLLGRWLLGLALALQGKRDEACIYFDSIRNDEPGNIVARIGTAMRHGLAGQRDEALEILHVDLDVCPLTHGDFGYAYCTAQCHAVVGDTAGALEWLERAVALGIVNYPYLSRYDPLLTPLHDEERFRNLMERVKKDWEAFEV
jgi:TolB-like protein/cytochrome c-type biogenesis protein CcmH/NrfG